MYYYNPQNVYRQAFAHNLWYYFYMENFVNKLKELRLEKGLTQAEVSIALGLSRNAFANYEKGLRQPSLETLKALCKFFNVTADYLLGLED